jgi:hypothetical protein
MSHLPYSQYGQQQKPPQRLPELLPPLGSSSLETRKHVNHWQQKIPK